MKICRLVSVASLLGAAGMAVAQPTVDGIFDAGTEGSFYGDILWTNNVATAFGDNNAGDFTGGNFGNPEAVATGVEIRVPLASLGLTGSETIRISGWVNSGDRTFKSNQIIGALPIDTTNLGGAQDFNAGNLAGTTQHVTANLASIASGTRTVDGSLDGGVAGTSYTRVFLTQNYTGFGNETDGTVDGAGPNGGGSEIDAVYLAKDATNLYIFVAGNLETNGNGLDIYLDTVAGGSTTLSGASGSGGFIPGGQSGLAFDTGFAADHVISVDSTDHDADGNTVNIPRIFIGSLSGTVFNAGTIPSYGVGAAPTGGDAGAPSVTLGVNNSNIAGVEGNPASPTPVAPDADWAYGSELNNVRSYIDTANNRLYVFIAGNMEVNYNKFSLFFDAQSGGQNPLLDTNVDISFNALNNQANIAFDAAFVPDYWMNVNNGVDGGTGALVNFTDAAVLRTNGANIDPFFGVITDYGSYHGGAVIDNQLLDFNGPRADIQDGSLGSLFAEYAPRLTADDALNPISNLIEVAINNSNVGGVTDSTADASAVNAVTTGIEISIDLDELGWDGVQDILMAGWISNAGFDFVSNQVLGGLPDGSANVGPRDADSDGTNDLDWATIAGDQFINLSADPVPPCLADLAEPFGTLNAFDVFAFLGAYNSQNPAADFAAPFGTFNAFDVFAFLGSYNAGCP
jgi:hypothetical protein